MPQELPYVLVLDRTEWHFGSTPVNILMIGVAHRKIVHRGIAFPVAWTARSRQGRPFAFGQHVCSRMPHRDGPGPLAPFCPRTTLERQRTAFEACLKALRTLFESHPDFCPVRRVGSRLRKTDIVFRHI